MDPAEADGENLGIVRFGPAGAAALVDIMDGLIDAGGRRDWAPRAFAEFAKNDSLHAVGTRGLPWIEIDFPEDYQRAVGEILPQLEPEPRPHSNVTAWDGRSERRAARADRRGLSLARRPSSAMLADAS